MVAILPKTRRHRRAVKGAADGRNRLDHTRAEIRELGRLGYPLIAKERDSVVAALMGNRRRLGQATTDASIAALAPMDLDKWVLWRPDVNESTSEIRVGNLREGVDGDMLPVPCVVTLGEGRGLVIVSRTDRQREEARSLWQAVVTRIAALSAGRAELVLLDPTGAGFVSGHRLFHSVVLGTDVTPALERWSADSRPSRPRIIAAADVPMSYTARDAALLLAMVRSAKSTGPAIVLHLDEDAYRSSVVEPDLGDSLSWSLIDVGAPELVDASVHARVMWDPAPSQALIDLVADRLEERSLATEKPTDSSGDVESLSDRHTSPAASPTRSQGSVPRPATQ